MSFLVLIRAIHFGAVLWLFGEFVFFTHVIKPALQTISVNASAAGDGATRRLMRTAIGCVAIAIASATAWLLLEAASMSGAPRAMIFDAQTLETVIGETLFGHVWMWRLAISLLLLVLLFVARTRPLDRAGLLRYGGTFLAGAYAASLACTGHAAAVAGIDRFIHLGCDAIHVLAAGAWVGALPALVGLLERARGTYDPDRVALASSAARRFSSVGLVAVSALAVTGLVNVSYLVGGVAAFVSTGYGRLLLLKLAIFGVMVALAARNRLHATPQFARAAAAAIGTPVPGVLSSAMARLRRNVALELAGGVMIVGIVAALGITVPATHMLGHTQSPTTTPAGHDH
jgi:copper resistance protein D